MTLTKKRLAVIAILLAVVYFIPLMFLPETIVGDRGDNLLLFIPRILFLALTAAMVTVFVLVFVFKRDFISWQIFSFNRFKHLLRLLVKRDFVTRYRKSALGVVWSLLNPLLTMLIMTLVFSHLFRFQIEHFPVYILSGQMIFGFFSESTSSAMSSLIGNAAIINKVYVPKYVFPLAKVLSSLVNLLFSFIAFLLVFTITGVPFRWTMLLIPIPIIYIFVFSLGVAMLMSSLVVFFRDLTHLYSVFLTMLMFLTPIMYPIDIIPEHLLPFWGFNPMYHFVDYFRALTLWGFVPDLWSNIVCIGFALASLCAGTYVFMRQQDRYILYL